MNYFLKKVNNNLINNNNIVEIIIKITIAAYLTIQIIFQY